MSINAQKRTKQSPLGRPSRPIQITTPVFCHVRHHLSKQNKTKNPLLFATFKVGCRMGGRVEWVGCV
jgi:hypothetical protein